MRGGGTTRAARWVVAAFMAVIVAHGCASAPTQRAIPAASGVATRLHRAPTSGASRVPIPLAWCVHAPRSTERGARADVSADATERGYRAFDRVCGNCHPDGDEDIGPRLIGRHFTEQQLWMQVRDGGGRMSAVPSQCMPDNYVSDAVVYLRAIGAVR
jgi:hypothetical protein